MEHTTSTPPVTLGQYKGLPVTRHLRPVSEKAVEQELAHLARTHTVYQRTVAPAQRGDRVVLDFEGFMDGQPIPDSKMEHVTAVLGEGQLMPAAEMAVCGHRAGEVFRFEFIYPANFRVPELSGKTAEFEINLRDVLVREVPALNDAFAKRLGYASIEAMRENVRNKKAKFHAENADRRAGAELLDLAGANATVDLPAQRVQAAAAKEMDKLKANLTRSGLTLEQHCEKNHTTPQQLEESYARDAERRMRNILVSQAISEAEQIHASPEEVAAEYLRLSRMNGTPVEEIRKALPIEAVAAALTSQKVQQFLLENAQVTTVQGSADKE